MGEVQMGEWKKRTYLGGLINRWYRYNKQIYLVSHLCSVSICAPASVNLSFSASLSLSSKIISIIWAISTSRRIGCSGAGDHCGNCGGGVCGGGGVLFVVVLVFVVVAVFVVGVCGVGCCVPGHGLDIASYFG